MADSPKDVRSQTLEAVRRDARRVENTLDQKLVSYSKFRYLERFRATAFFASAALRACVDVDVLVQRPLHAGNAARRGPSGHVGDWEHRHRFSVHGH